MRHTTIAGQCGNPAALSKAKGAPVGRASAQLCLPCPIKTDFICGRSGRYMPVAIFRLMSRSAG
jgi:hypothetical protein